MESEDQIRNPNGGNGPALTPRTLQDQEDRTLFLEAENLKLEIRRLLQQHQSKTKRDGISFKGYVYSKSQEELTARFKALSLQSSTDRKLTTS